ncbi:MAG: DUF3168 domain-containing protein [Hyphomonadaceae bacterium]
MEDSLNAALREDAAVGAIVGAGASARVYPLVLPQSVNLPAVTYQRISTPRVVTTTLSGPNARVNCRMQVDCWAGTFAQAKALSSAVRAALLSADSFTAIAIDNRDLYEPGDRADGLSIFRSSADYSCWYLE